MTDHELIAKLAEALEETRMDLFYQIQSKFDSKTARNYPSNIKAEKALALARQHKAWRHLDRDEEKPGDGETCLVYDAQFLEPYKATYGLHSNKFFSPMCVGFNPRWWMPLPSPPKEES